jgi:hypothetical protein
MARFWFIGEFYQNQQQLRTTESPVADHAEL